MVYFRETQKTIHARMFGPLIGIQEDPATGSAAAALAGLLVSNGSTNLTLYQGHDLGRPSTLHLRVSGSAGGGEQIQVGGACVPMIEGRLGYNM